MKEIKTKFYLLIMYIGIVLVDVIKLVIDALNVPYRTALGFWTKFGIILLRNLIDIAIIYLIGLCVDLVLKRFLEKTLVPNIVITFLIYEILLTLI